MADLDKTEHIAIGATPLVQQIISLLLQELQSLGKQEPLLPEVQLAEKFDVSRKTIRAAMKRLEDEGLVRRIKRKGTFPTKGPNCKPLFRRDVQRIALVTWCEATLSPNSYQTSITRGVLNKAFNDNYQVLLAGGKGKTELTEAIFNLAADSNVDGIILVSVTNQQVLSDLGKWKKPVCLIDHYSDNPNIDCIRTHSNKGSQLAIEHLFRLGHKKIGYADTKDPATNPARLKGFHEGLKTWKLKKHNDWVFHGDTQNNEAEDIAMQFLSLPAENRPTALLAFSDSMADSIKNILTRFGLSIPKDLSIIGTQGYTSSSTTNTMMTNICYDWEKLGQTGFDTLIDRITHSHKKGENILIPPVLEVGSSTTAPN